MKSETLWSTLTSTMKRRTAPLFERLDVAVGLGLLVGCLYIVMDVYFDHVMGAKLVPSAHPIQVVHAIIDLVLPAIAGASLGFVIHFTRVRAQMAAFEKQRADELAGHIHKIERDQAVWVISASLLHELKNPLHALGLLLDEVAELGADAEQERERLLGRARIQSERIEERLMALRSLEHHTPADLPLLDLRECLTTTLEPLMGLASRQGVTLELEGSGVFAYAHPGYLRIIVENLVENAMDALKPVRDGKITLTVRSEDELALVYIFDNGPGLNEVTRKKVFDPLFTQKETGLGLGLSIARGLARSIGGDLTLQRTESGTCFQVALGAGAP